MADRPEDYEVRLPAPNGCAVCGSDRLNHPQQWHPSTGFHIWRVPTDAQRLARMKARRTARFREIVIEALVQAWGRLQPGGRWPSQRTGKPGTQHPRVLAEKRRLRADLLLLMPIRDPKAVVRVTGI